MSISDNLINVENVSDKVETSLLGVHVIFEDKYTIVAEITKINNKIIECLIVGEFVNGKFQSGMTHKPKGSSKIRLISNKEVVSLVGDQSIDSENCLYLGRSLIYEGFNVSANLNNFFSNHFTIIGNTGSGKSCTVARIMQNLFYRKQYVPVNSKIVLFDVYGEYHNAFERINDVPNCRYKSLTTNPNATDSELLKIPPYFLETDDIALLLHADDPSQIPLIEKAMRYVYLFTEDEATV